MVKRVIKPHETAKQAFDRRIAEIEALQAKLAAVIESDKAGFKASGEKDWGYVGNLGDYAELLRRAIGEEE